MTIEQLQTLHQARPFQPFRIHMANGQAVDVNHPELLAHGGGRTMTVYTGQENSEIIDLLLVSSLERIDGRSKRTRPAR